MWLMLTLLLQTDGPNPLTAPRIILALLCVVILSSVALAVLIGMARRIQTIAGPAPSDETDGTDDTPPPPARRNSS